MRSILDFSSWQGFLGTIIGLLVMTLLMVGIRLVFMQTIQRKRERENRQINERLRTLIAAYKTLGGSFTGDLTVDPRHKREQDAVQAAAPQAVRSELDLVEELQDHEWGPVPDTIAERRRRTRDAVEAALSDIILLGTEEQVRLAAKAAQDMVDGRPVRLAALVHSLRTFIRSALYLEDIPADVRVPDQGPVRPGSGPGGGGRMGAGAGNARGGGGGGGGGGAGGAAAGGGAGMGMGMAMGGREDR